MNALHPIFRFRATGRTSRALADAIEKAKEGRYVFFLTGSEKEVKRAMHLAYDALRLDYDSLDIRHAGDKIYIPAREQKNGIGSISFAYIRDVEYDWKRKRVVGAIQSSIVIVDPYAVEDMFYDVLIAYHEYDPKREEIRQHRGYQDSNYNGL